MSMAADTTITEKWPWPRDDATTRARKVALAFRAALGANNRALRDSIDETMLAYGQTWIVDQEIVTESDGMDAVTTREAAALAHVPEYEIRRWATLDDPRNPGRKLLPRFKRQGREMTYLVDHVVSAAKYVHGDFALPQVDPRI